MLQEDEERDETESLADGIASVASGFASSLPSGIETPSEIDLRKTSEGPRQLYTVLEQQKASVGAGTLMGSEHTYVIPGTQQGKEKLSIAAQASPYVVLPPQAVDGICRSKTAAVSCTHACTGLPGTVLQVLCS